MKSSLVMDATSSASGGAARDTRLVMVLGLGGALLAAVLYGVGTVLQARGVAGRPSVYAAGLACDGLGFLASLLALRRLPLFVVESMMASSVAVTALLAAWWLGARLSRRELTALGAVGVGLVALAATGREGAVSPHGAQPGIWLCLAVAPLLAAGAASYLLEGAWSGPALAVVSGLGFGATGVAARVLHVHGWGTLGEPALWALAAHGVISIVSYAYALARARVTAVAAVTFVVETIVPTVVGVAWLGDGTRHGTAPLAVAGLALTLAGCVVLARFASPEAEARRTLEA